MSEVASKPDLLEQGTRYDHYVELREVFASGIEVISNQIKRGRDVMQDRVLKVKLEGAVEVINKRLSYLSNYERETIYSARLPETLREIEEDRKANAKAQPENPNQVRPPQDQKS